MLTHVNICKVLSEVLETYSCNLIYVEKMSLVIEI